MDTVDWPYIFSHIDSEVNNLKRKIEKLEEFRQYIMDKEKLWRDGSSR